jgi:type VI secretion system secreted protein VgrG
MSDTSGSQSFVSLTLSPDPGFVLNFDRLRGTEELGRPFRFDIEASSKTAKPDLVSLLGSSATLAITLPDKSKRYFNGIVARATFDGLIGGAYHYRLELRPWIWLLSRTQDCRIFQNKSVWDIITQIFSDAGFSGSVSDKRQNQAGSQVLEYCVQYNETSLDFVTRLMEVYGLYYYFTHADGQHTLVMADDPNSHSALAKSLSYVFEQTEYRTVDAHVWDWGSEQRLQPGAATFRDYNFTTPAADLTGKSIQSGSHPHGSFEVYEYPGPYGTADDGQKLAAVRMQHFAAERQTLRGVSNARDLHTGCKFTLTDFTDASQNREYLVISANYSIDAAEAVQGTEGELADTFRCAFAAIPGDTPFRLDCITRWPTMRGPQTAKVVGESGEEITTDQYGRIKVQFFWDRLGQNDQNSSCWIRVAQIWAGANWGGIYIPRIGQEVVVDFLDGNPDRPIVTGCVYNASMTVPYALPDNKTRSTIKTNSSTGGGGFNELRFEDKAGSEEVFLQAQKDFNVVVLNNETVKITQDQTITVDKGNRSLTLNEGNNTLTVSKGNNTTTVSQGNNSLTVSQGNNSTTVSQGNESLTVSQGNHSIEVTAGSSTISAGQSITLKVGSNSITIDTTGVSINGTKIALSANAELTANGGGEMTLQAGLVKIN